MKENAHLLAYMDVFIQVADSGSFSEAARRLGISQPSVSRQVGALEESLGIRLLQRTTRRMSLTEAGEIYYRQVRQIQRDVIEAGNSISAFKETPSGLLKIGAPVGWTEIIIAPYLGEFMRAYPDIELDIQCTDMIQDIVEDRLDLVLRVGPLLDSSYVAQPLSKVKLVVSATERYLNEHGQPVLPADLAQHNCIMFNSNNQWVFKRGGSEQLIQVRGRVNTQMVSVMISMALQHMGVMLLPVQLIRRALASGELVEIFADYSVCYSQLGAMDVFVLYSNRKYLPAKVRAFIDFFRGKI
ncbi:Transcriptional regulator, LysR family [hydrothermal vent metagenome]|uniref:Transcriptional regulator, LysR family n=1 Tax=hydrothermal vent metagenome TaxID=652676 RepID=A0A3B0XKN8_9ZZZZ